VGGGSLAEISSAAAAAAAAAAGGGAGGAGAGTADATAAATLTAGTVPYTMHHAPYSPCTVLPIHHTQYATLTAAAALGGMSALGALAGLGAGAANAAGVSAGIIGNGMTGVSGTVGDALYTHYACTMHSLCTHYRYRGGCHSGGNERDSTRRYWWPGRRHHADHTGTVVVQWQ
jgi:hypothetical protein